MGKTASVVFSAEQLEFIDAFPGGVVSYRIKENTLIPISYSNGFVRLFGYDAEEFEPILQKIRWVFYMLWMKNEFGKRWRQPATVRKF